MPNCLNCDTIVESEDLINVLENLEIKSISDLYQALKLEKICCRLLLFNAKLLEIIVSFNVPVENLY